MSQSNNKSNELPDYQIELAKQRNRIAAERTLLAWIRITISLIGIGFLIERSITKLYSGLGIEPATTFISVKILSILFIALGTILVIIATLDYQGEIKRLQQPKYYYQPRISLGIIVAIILIIIGLSIFVSILRKLL